MWSPSLSALLFYLSITYLQITDRHGWTLVNILYCIYIANWWVSSIKPFWNEYSKITLFKNYTISYINGWDPGAFNFKLAGEPYCRVKITLGLEVQDKYLPLNIL